MIWNLFRLYQWRDRTYHAAWAGIAAAATYATGKWMGSWDHYPMPPQGWSFLPGNVHDLVQTIYVWQFLYPFIIGAGGTFFLMVFLKVVFGVGRETYASNENQHWGQHQ